MALENYVPHIERKIPAWFRAYRAVIRLFVKKPRFVRLGSEEEEPSVIVSNHEGAAGPMTWEMYYSKLKTFWVAHENTEGLRSVYRYLAHLYFPQKKHILKWLSAAFAFVASPFVWLFYVGLSAIPTYSAPDKLISTVRMSETELTHGCSVIIFPEDSSSGYFKKPAKFFGGFVLLCDRMLKKGVDLPVLVTYFSKKRRILVFDEPIRYSVLRRLHGSREVIAEKLRQRMCELADISDRA
ncbi:MAG: hypothetical protein J6P98_01850 [Clostridia bacterium]|nr:hypothetical protein [Clostridia bacterium]